MSLCLMDGNEAIARAAMAAGCRFLAGYPITPTMAVFNAMLALLPPAGGICLQSEDEIASNKEIGMTRETVDLDGVVLPQIIDRCMAEEGEPYVPFEASDENPTPPFLPVGGNRLVRTTSSTHGADGYITTDPEQIARFQARLFKRVQAGMDRFTFFGELERPGAETLVITYGVTARAARVAVEAAGKSGRPASLLALKTLWLRAGAADPGEGRSLPAHRGGRNEPRPIRPRNHTGTPRKRNPFPRPNERRSDQTRPD